MPLMDQAIQSDDTGIHHPITSHMESANISATSHQTQQSAGQKVSKNVGLQSAPETEEYGPGDAMEEDTGGGGDDDNFDDSIDGDDVQARVKMEPGVDLDHIPPAMPSSSGTVTPKDEHFSSGAIDDEDDSGGGGSSGPDDDDLDDQQDVDFESWTGTSSLSSNTAALQQSETAAGQQIGSVISELTPSSASGDFTSIKPFQCAICHKAFRSVQILQKHSVTFHKQGQRRIKLGRSKNRSGGKQAGGHSGTSTQSQM